MSSYDAVVVGAGPNGLAAAITLARGGAKVLVVEKEDAIGGGMRTESLTRPGFRHDVCSAVHPLAACSPFFKSASLERFGLEWINPEIVMAHPWDNGSASALYRSVEETAATLGRDQDAYEMWMNRFLPHAGEILPQILKPAHKAKLSLPLVRFGFQAILPAAVLARRLFKGTRARSFLAGMAAHSMMDLDLWMTGAYGILFPLMGHDTGWPFPRGGAQNLARALQRYMEELGIEVITGREIKQMSDIPDARFILFDLTPRQILKIAGGQFPSKQRRRLEQFRYGPGVFKVDWALSDPIPFTSEICRKAPTLHLGAAFKEIHHSEKQIWKGHTSDHPFTILVQHGVADASRAPDTKYTAWAYCHVPHGSTDDRREAIERQIIRFAPGFREVVLEAHTMNTSQYEQYNANYIGGDINGGIQDIRQFVLQPVRAGDPYHLGGRLFICSSSTPPGGGVHGMCGFNAAQSVRRQSERLRDCS